VSRCQHRRCRRGQQSKESVCLLRALFLSLTPGHRRGLPTKPASSFTQRSTKLDQMCTRFAMRTRWRVEPGRPLASHWRCSPRTSATSTTHSRSTTRTAVSSQLERKAATSLERWAPTTRHASLSLTYLEFRGLTSSGCNLDQSRLGDSGIDC